MNKYQVVNEGGIEVEGQSHATGAIVELEAAAESTLKMIEEGFIKIFEGDEKEEPVEPEEGEEPVEPEEPVKGEPAEPVEPEKPAAPVEPTPVQKATAQLQANYPVPPAPFESMPPMLYAFCKAIEAHEVCAAPGTDARFPQGTRSYFDKNPGNLKYRGQAGTITEDKDGFAIFASIDEGFTALAAQVVLAISGKSTSYKNPTWDPVLKAWRDMNFSDFFKIYDSSHGDNPAAYAQDVADALDVPVTTPINQLI